MKGAIDEGYIREMNIFTISSLTPIKLTANNQYFINGETDAIMKFSGH